MDITEKVIGKAVDAIKEVPKDTDSCLHAGDNSSVQTEREKISFPVNLHRKTYVQNKTPELLTESLKHAVAAGFVVTDYRYEQNIHSDSQFQ